LKALLIPFKESLNSVFYLDLVRPSKRMEFRHIDEFAHGAIRLAGIKLNSSLKAYGLDNEPRELTDGQLFTRTYIDVTVANLA